MVDVAEGYCASCGEDVDTLDGRCKRCGRVTIREKPLAVPRAVPLAVPRAVPVAAHVNGYANGVNGLEKPTLAGALATLIQQVEHEVSEQEKARLRAGDAVSTGRAVLVHLKRAVDAAQGKQPTTPKTKASGVTACSECGAAISGTGATGLCRKCAGKKYSPVKHDAAS